MKLIADSGSDPRLHAAASLKGLQLAGNRPAQQGDPRLHAAASLKDRVELRLHLLREVIRGYMPRPH